MEAVIPNSHSRLLTPLRKQLFKSNSQYHSAPRYPFLKLSPLSSVSCIFSLTDTRDLHYYIPSLHFLTNFSKHRWDSSQKTNTHNKDHDNNNEEPSHNVNPKPKPKPKNARAMAQLINSKPWSNDLQTSLSPLLSKTTLLQTLRLITTPTKAFQFFNWVQEMGFSHTAQSYFMMLEILGRHRNLNAARNFLFSIEKRSDGAVKLEDRFFNSLIRSYGQAGLFQESIKLFSDRKSVV